MRAVFVRFCYVWQAHASRNCVACPSAEQDIFARPPNFFGAAFADGMRSLCFNDARASVRQAVNLMDQIQQFLSVWTCVFVHEYAI